MIIVGDRSAFETDLEAVQMLPIHVPLHNFNPPTNQAKTAKPDAS